MSWLHIARIDGHDSTGAWLVVPGINDPLFRWAITQDSTHLRYLPSFEGWLVPSSVEHLLWNAIAATYGPDIVCQQCLHGQNPCDTWIHLVARRFEARRQQSALSFYGTMPAEPWTPNRDRARRPGYWQQQYEAPPPPRHRRPPPPPAPPPRRSKNDEMIEAAAVLGITWPSTKAEITKAFRKAAMKHHPDLGGTDEAMKRVLRARDTLLGSV